MRQARAFPRLLSLSLLMFGAILLMACWNPKLRPSGFLDDYHSLRLDKKASVFYSDPPGRPSAPIHIIVLRDPQWRAGDDVSPALAKTLCETFKTRLRIRILQKIEGVIVFEQEKDLAAFKDQRYARVMVIESAITRAWDGSGAVRYLVGYGFGAARVTVEARAISPSPRAEIHQVVSSARSTGNPHNGLNPRAISSKYTLRLAMDVAAKRIAKHLAKRIQAPQEEWWASMYGPGARTVPRTQLASAHEVMNAPAGAVVLDNPHGQTAAFETAPGGASASNALRAAIENDMDSRSEAPAGSSRSGETNYPPLPMTMMAGLGSPRDGPQSSSKADDEAARIAMYGSAAPKPQRPPPAPPSTPGAPFQFAVRDMSLLMPPSPGGAIVVRVDYTLAGGAPGERVEIDGRVRLVRKGKTLAFKKDMLRRGAGDGQLRMLLRIPPEVAPGGAELEVMVRAAGAVVGKKADIVIGN